MSSDEKIRLGQEARQLLGHPILVKFFRIETARLFERFTQDLTEEEAIRLNHEAAALRRLKGRLEGFVKTGEIEEQRENGERSIADGIGPVI